MEDIRFRPVVISKLFYDLFLKKKNAFGPIALYNFYYYTAIWQETNQPHATISYAAEGLGTTEARIRKWKKQLIAKGLIEEIIERNEKHQITNHFIKVIYYSKKATLIENNRVENHKQNAYSNNSKRTVSGKRLPLTDSFGKKIEPTFDERLAKKLFECLLNKRKIMRSVKINKWSRVFKSIRTEEGIEKPRIKEVLNWYIDHISEKYIPQAYSAQSFKDKFFKIETAMERNKPKEKIEITEDATDIYNKLKTYGWPKGSKNDLEEAIQITLNNYRVFLKKHKNFIKTHPEDIDNNDGTFTSDGLVTFANTLNHTVIHSPVVFVTNWFLRINGKITNWPNWGGNLLGMVFEEDSAEFNMMGRQRAEEYCNNPKRWDKYIKAINEN